MFDLPGANIRDVVELAGRWRVTPEALLHGLPVTMAALANPTTRVPIRVCEVIITRACALTGEPALAFHFGTSMRVSSHGFLGFAAMTAGTAREALELAVRFAGTRTSAVGLALYVEGGAASLVVEERAELGAMREFVMLGLMVGLWRLGHALTGQMLDGAGELAFPEPDYMARLPLGGRLRFAQPVNRLVFAASVLDLPLAAADAVATQLARERCESELAILVEAGLPRQIRQALTARPAAAVVAVARELRMSSRTLKRRLADHGTTFSALRDDVRLQRALLMLDSRVLSIGEIGGHLGYTELPNFTRAFRKWTGLTPAAYRARRSV